MLGKILGTVVNDLFSNKTTRSEAVKNFNDVDAKLKKELARCEIYAAEGYQIAYPKYLELQKTLSAESQRLADANVAQNQVGRIENTELIGEQATELSKLKKDVDAIGEDIADLHDRNLRLWKF